MATLLLFGGCLNLLCCCFHDVRSTSHEMAEGTISNIIIFFFFECLPIINQYIYPTTELLTTKDKVKYVVTV